MSIPASILEGWLIAKEGLTEDVKSEVKHAIKLLNSVDSAVQNSRKANVKSASLTTYHSFIKGEMQPDWHIDISVNPINSVDHIVIKNVGLLNFIEESSKVDAPIQRGVIHGKVE